MIGGRHCGKAWFRALSGAIAALVLVAMPATAADIVRIAAQKTGTLAWELAVARAHGLDAQAGLEIVTTDLATPEGGKIALRAGSVDVIVSDLLWVSRERALGGELVFYPYSSALGAVTAAPGAPICALAGLKGRSLAVAGGSLDKSWLLLRAALKQDGVELTQQAIIAYGAPALLAAKTLRGEFDATLNYWNICADLEAKGLRRVVGIEDILPSLGARGASAMLGYVFDERWAAQNRDAVARFVAVTRMAKDALATSDTEWQRIAPLAGVADPAALKLLRDRYRAGIPHRPIAEKEADARVLYGVLARLGGADLVGPAAELARHILPAGGMIARCCA